MTLPPDMRALLDAEKKRPDAPAEAKAEAERRLATLLGPSSGLGGGGGDAGGSGSPAAGKPAPSVAASSSPVALKIAAGVVIGALAGGGLVAVSRPSPVAPPVIAARSVDVPAAAPVAPSASPLAQEPALDAAPPVLEPRARTPRASASASASPSLSASRDVDLATERSLLERARSALARGDATAALLATAQHEREFPDGKLVEEREVLAVEALVKAGRTSEAAERGARFRKAYPRSLLLPTLDRALR